MSTDRTPVTEKYVNQYHGMDMLPDGGYSDDTIRELVLDIIPNCPEEGIQHIIREAQGHALEAQRLAHQAKQAM